MSGYRPKTGGYNWRQEIVALIQSERDEVALIQRMVEGTDNVAAVRALSALLAEKTRRISRLYELLDYRDDE
ncbi:MAG: hypothetical protein KatS3mg051_1035 [Anaerolineae bacterium]|nr:MAG: hypothetical protein KatS3mg051_1035 [Anaerolineae bacterium]